MDDAGYERYYELTDPDAFWIRPPDWWGEWEGAIYILRSPLIREIAAQHVDESRRHVDWGALMERAESEWSSSEYLLAATALELWNGSSGVGLRKLLDTLDDGNLEVVLEAMRRWRGWDCRTKADPSDLAKIWGSR
jgi:hypothetical protein